METTAIWLQAIRPKTLIISISPVFIGITMALSDGFFNLTTLLFTFICAMGIQIGTNLANDYFDYVKGSDTSESKGPMKVTQAGLVSHAKMKKAIICTFSFTFLCGLYLVWQGGFAIAILLLLSIFFGIIYTAGPFPLAYLGLGDIFVFIFFGPIAVAGTYYLQTHTLSTDCLIAGIGPGALATAVLAVCNLRDIEEDRLVHKKTLAVRFGKTFAKFEFLSLILCAAITPAIFYNTHPFSFLSLIILFPIIPLTVAIFKNKDPRQLNAIFPKVARLLLAYSFLFSLGWML
jgi:1,4-dihydroxy-2-naphthoate polyprenyltransferase